MDTARTDQLELAWRIAAERVQAETEEAKAKAIVDGYVQAAIARAWTDIGLKKSHEKTSQALQNKRKAATDTDDDSRRRRETSQRRCGRGKAWQDHGRRGGHAAPSRG